MLAKERLVPSCVLMILKTIRKSCKQEEGISLRCTMKRTVVNKMNCHFSEEFEHCLQIR